jgi:hypothetical protein
MEAEGSSSVKSRSSLVGNRKHCVLFGECECASSPRDGQADTLKRGCLMSQEITHTHTCERIKMYTVSIAEGQKLEYASK